MDNITERNIIENINYTWIMSDTTKNSVEGTTALLVAIGLLMFFYDKPLAIVHTLLGVICLAVTNYTLKLDKKQPIDAAFIRGFSSGYTMAQFLTVLVLFEYDGLVKPIASPLYIAYCAILISYALISLLGYIVLKPYFKKKNFRLKKLSSGQNFGITIAAASIPLVFGAIRFLVGEYNYIGLLCGTLMFINVAMFISLGGRLVYFEMLYKDPDLAEKCYEARPGHEQEFAATDSRVSEYLAKKSLEQNKKQD